MLCLFRSSGAESEGGQGACGVPGVAAAAGVGDVASAGELEDSYRQVAQGGHDLGSGAGADLGGVLSVADVADVVEHLDVPVTADPFRELGGCGLAGVHAGDRVDGDGAPFPGGQRPDPAGEADGLGGVREGDPGCKGGDLQGAPLVPAMAAVALGVTGRDVPPGRLLTCAYKPGWFFLRTRM